MEPVDLTGATPFTKGRSAGVVAAGGYVYASAKRLYEPPGTGRVVQQFSSLASPHDSVPAVPLQLGARIAHLFAAQCFTAQSFATRHA